MRKLLKEVEERCNKCKSYNKNCSINDLFECMLEELDYGDIIQLLY